MKPPVYPNVRCRMAGHPDEPGYYVCLHVTEGAAVAYSEAPTSSSLGQLVCSKTDEYHQPHDFVIVCAHCVRSNGWNRRAA